VAYKAEGSKIKYGCEKCGMAIINFPFASYYRMIGICNECASGEEHAEVQKIRNDILETNKKDYIGKKDNKAKDKSKSYRGEKTQCKGYTQKSDYENRCKNKALSNGYCKYHQIQATEERTPYLSYETYISSPEWREKALECKHKRFWVCALCGGKADHAHHNSYKNLGDEMPHELTPLCDSCHKDFHNNHEYNNQEHKWERV